MKRQAENDSPTVSPTDYTFCLERCNGVVTWSFFRRFYRRNDRGIQIEIAVQWHGTITNGITDGMYLSMIPSVKTIIYAPSADTLFLCFSFFFFSPSSSFPSHLSPPKLQPTTHLNSPLFSTQALKFLIPCTWSKYSFLVDLSFFL